MGWQERLRQAAYTSPSGLVENFDYEDVSKSFDKKTTVFNFPDGNNTHVQDLGNTTRRIPLNIIFWGDSYDQKAARFEEMIQEKGVGRLEHPVYGVVSVVPSGTVKRVDRLKTAANQTVITIEFIEISDAVFPAPGLAPEDQINTAVKEYNTAAAAQYENATDLTGTVEQASLRATVELLVGQVKGALQTVADTTEAVRQQFNAVESAIQQSITTAVGEPLSLAFQSAILIQAPARANTLIADRLSAYNDLFLSLTTGPDAIAVPGLDSDNSNKYHTRDLYASTYVTGSILSVVNHQFQTKPEATAAATAILDQIDALIEWRDDNFDSLAQVDTGEAYQQLIEAAALAAGYLVEISFDLQQERKIVTESRHTPIDLVAELYGEVDGKLDFFINSNNLTGSEILEIPAGREIVYYV